MSRWDEESMKGIRKLMGEGRAKLGVGVRLPGPVENSTDVSEKDFQAAIVAHAKRHGWLVYHTYDSRRSEKGLPDLVMVRGGVLIFAELKVGDNKPTAEQQTWLDELHAVRAALEASRAIPGRGGAVCVYLWTPADWPAIFEILR